MQLSKYLQRINYHKAPQVDLATLTELHRLHAYNIAFENLDVHLQQSVSLDKNQIIHKLLQPRGGYCYELNGAFCDLLTTIGFEVKYLTSRPMFGYQEIRPKTHMILLVELAGEQYLADLGFTGLSLIEPIKLQADIINQQGQTAYRIKESEERGYILQSCEKANATEQGEWASLFSFDLAEQAYIDFKLANYFNSNSVESVCTQKVIVARYFEQGRIRLIDNQLKIRLAEQQQDIRITTESQLDDVLQTWFGIQLAPEQVTQIFNQIDNPVS